MESFATGEIVRNTGLWWCMNREEFLWSDGQGHREKVISLVTRRYGEEICEWIY